MASFSQNISRNCSFENLSTYGFSMVPVYFGTCFWYSHWVSFTKIDTGLVYDSDQA